ncbi:MAG TPA: carboxymuconolactone decarboxylase family protein [Candidatus Binatia bacterium]|nr:carboxymuconolactone decarboxylase family protein [Candidatus Binatia bacterium]
MSERIDYTKVGSGALRAMYGLEKYLAESSVEKPLRELIKVRASQMNGCAYCIDMHWKDARAAGETEQRLYGVSAWREAPYYSDRERAALDWTEALTLIANDHVSDELYERVRRQFSEQELVDLTMAVVTINAWNRIAISFRAQPGSYQPPQRH